MYLCTSGTAGCRYVRICFDICLLLFQGDCLDYQIADADSAFVTFERRIVAGREGRAEKGKQACMQTGMQAGRQAGKTQTINKRQQATNPGFPTLCVHKQQAANNKQQTLNSKRQPINDNKQQTTRSARQAPRWLFEVQFLAPLTQIAARGQQPS